MSTESAPTTTQLPPANADVNLEHETQGASTNSPVSPAPAPALTSDSDARTSPFIVMLKVGVDLDAFLAETGIVPYMKTPMQAPEDNFHMWFAANLRENVARALLGNPEVSVVNRDAEVEFD